MYISLKATKMVQQTDQLLVLQICWHVASWYSDIKTYMDKKCSPWSNQYVLDCFLQILHKFVVRVFINI